MSYSLPDRKTNFPDTVQTLVCKIIIWNPVNKGVYETPPQDRECLIIREVEDIEIEDNYKKLINTAVVRFPVGTVIQRTISPEDKEKYTGVYVERMDDGAIIERRRGGSMATPDHFHTGQRIRIYLGYYEETWETANDYQARMDVIEKSFPATPDFDGYIVKCSASSPIEIKCENIASLLKTKTCRGTPPREHVLVNELFKTAKDGGKYDLLAGTGIQLYPKTKKCDIDLGKIGIPEDWTVADLLTSWEQSHLYTYIKYDEDKPYLVIGHTYFSGDIDSSILKYTRGNANGTYIQFDHDVANDNLTLMNTDPLYLAVEAQSMTKDGKFYKVTIALNPDWDSHDPGSEKFRLINETHLSQKTMKLLGVVGDKIKQKVDLSLYNVVPFISSNIGISKEQLVKEAKAYFESYNFNGVEGSLTIFGDYHVRTGEKVALRDDRHPEKSGLYFVEEVSTKFGVNGFRQTLHLPYCIAKPDLKEKDKK